VRLTCEQLPAQLSKGLAPVYAIHGAETLLALEAADRVRTLARKAGFTERDVLIAESGFSWNDLAVASRSQSLFAEKKIIDLRVPSGKPGSEGSTALQAFCRDVSPGVVLLASFPRLDRTQQSSAWFEALDRSGVTVEAAQVARVELPRWIGARLKTQGQQADAATLDFLAEQVEGNLLAAFQEIQKLALLFPAGSLSIEQARSAVTDVARFDVFKLTDALAEADAGRFARMLRGLREEGEAPPLVLWALTDHVRALIGVKRGLAAGTPIAQLFRDYRIWGPRQRAVEQAARRLNLATLEAALMQAAACDRIIKGLVREDVWQSLLKVGLRLCGREPLPQHAVLAG
jgi:DNA polymerase III subunit delta